MKAVVTLDVPSPVLSVVDDRSGPSPKSLSGMVLPCGRLRHMRRGVVRKLRIGSGLVMILASVLVSVQGDLRQAVTIRAQSRAIKVEDQVGNRAPREGFALVQENGNWVRLEERWAIHTARDPRRERSARRRWDPRRHRRGRG